MYRRRSTLLIILWTVTSNIAGVCVSVGARAIDDIDRVNNIHILDAANRRGDPVNFSRHANYDNSKHHHKTPPSGRRRRDAVCLPEQYYDAAVSGCSNCKGIVPKCAEKLIRCPQECDDSLLRYIDSKGDSTRNETHLNYETASSVATSYGYYFIAIGVVGGPLLVFVLLCMVYVCRKKVSRIKRSRILEGRSPESPIDVPESHLLLSNVSEDTDYQGHQRTVNSTESRAIPVSGPLNQPGRSFIQAVTPTNELMAFQAGERNIAEESHRDTNRNDFTGGYPEINPDMRTHSPSDAADLDSPGSLPADFGSMPESVAMVPEADSGNDSDDNESDSGNLSDDGYRMTVSDRSRTSTDKHSSVCNPSHFQSPDGKESDGVPCNEQPTNENSTPDAEPLISQADHVQDEETDDDEVSVKQVTRFRETPATLQKELTGQSSGYREAMKLSIEAHDCDYKIPSPNAKCDQSFVKTSFYSTSPKTTSLILDLREGSQKCLHTGVSIEECGKTPRLPRELESGPHSARMVFLKIDWIEEYLKFGNKWEVNITPGYSVRRAKDILTGATGLSSDKLEVNIYESCGSSFERHGPPAAHTSIGPGRDMALNEISQTPVLSGDEGFLIRQANPDLDISSLRLPLLDIDGLNQMHDLLIGEKMFWYKNGTLFSVTIGSFVKVTGQEGEICICAQTTCEGAKEGAACYVPRHEKYVQFGKVKFKYEHPCFDNLSYDIMLVEIDLSHFAPVPLISVKNNKGGQLPHELKLADTKMSALAFGYQIKKLTSNKIGELPDGELRYPDISSKKGHYYGLTGVTSFTDPPSSVSDKGDCGTLVTGLPSGGRIEVYGAVIGADRRTDRNTGTRIRFTVLTPMKESFDRLRKDYELQSVEFLGKEWETSEINATDSAIANNEANMTASIDDIGDGMTDYYNINVANNDKCTSLEQELMVDSGFQTMPNSPSTDDKFAEC